MRRWVSWQQWLELLEGAQVITAHIAACLEIPLKTSVSVDNFREMKATDRFHIHES